MPFIAKSVGRERRPAEPWRAWLVVFLCMLAYVLSFIDRQILSLLIGPIRADLHISDTQFGLLNGLAFSIFYATMGVPIASLADHSSRPRIITIGVLVWSAATMACGLARSFGQLFVSRILVGAGEAALSPAAYSLIADLFPRERIGRALAVYSLGSLLGSGIAFLVGGAIISVVSTAGDYVLAGMTFSMWQVTFLIVGAPGLLLGIVIVTLVNEPRNHSQDTRIIPPLSGVFRELLDNLGIYLPLMLGFSIFAMGLYGFLGWSPAFLMRTYGMKPQQAGLVLGIIAILAGGGGNLVSGWLIDAFTRRGLNDAPFRVGMIGASGILLPAIAIGFTPPQVVSYVLLAIGFFFASFVIAPATTIMQIAAPPAMRSRVSAIFLFCNSFIGLALSSALIGLANDSLFAGKNIAGSLALVIVSGAVVGFLGMNLGRRPFATRHPY